MPMTTHAEITTPTDWSAQAPQLQAWCGEARLFFGVAPTAAQQQQLSALQGQLPEAVRAVPLSNLHLTLRFLGQVSYAQALLMCQQLDELQLPHVAGGAAIQFAGSGQAASSGRFANWEQVEGLGQVASSSQVASSALAGAPALRQFRVRLDTIEWWPGSAVVCLAGLLTDPALAALDSALDSLALAQGLAPRQHPLRPHITLARPARQQVQLQAPVMELIGRELLLYHSCSSPTGVQYLPLARWPLVATRESGGCQLLPITPTSGHSV